MHTDLSGVSGQPLPDLHHRVHRQPPCAGEHNPQVPGAEGEGSSFILFSAAPQFLRVQAHRITGLKQEGRKGEANIPL